MQIFYYADYSIVLEYPSIMGKIHAIRVIIAKNSIVKTSKGTLEVCNLQSLIIYGRPFH